MVRIQNRPRPGDFAGRESSFESSLSGDMTPKTNYTKRTLDTSSLSSLDTSKWHLPNLSKEDELVLLRRRIQAYERCEEQLNIDLVRTKRELESCKESVIRWKEAVRGDVRPGSHYRQEIVCLKHELDEKNGIIQQRDTTIQNMMAGGSHPSFVEHHEINETSVCSSILDEAVENPTAREMERLLLENSKFVYRLRERDEEVIRLRNQITLLEQERINSELSPLSMPFSPFQEDEQESSTYQLGTANNSYGHGDSLRTTKRLMELQNELSKRTEEVDYSFQCKLEQFQDEAKRLRMSQAKKIRGMISELNGAKLALHAAEVKAKDSASAIAHHKATIRDMKTEMRKRDAAILELRKAMKQKKESNLSTQQVEVQELKQALDESLEELENATKVATEQRKTIQNLRKESNDNEINYLQVQRYLEVETENLENTKKELLKQESKMKEVNNSKSELEETMSSDVESLKNKIQLRENKIERLQQDLFSTDAQNHSLELKLVEKETEINELNLLLRNLRPTLDSERKGKVEGRDTRANLQESLKKEYEYLLQKTNRQNIQLHNTDKILLEKEQEKARLKASLEELCAKLDRFEAEKDASERKIVDENDEIVSRLQEERDSLRRSLEQKLADQDAMVKDVTILQKHLEEKDREVGNLRETLRSNTKTIESQLSKIQEIEKLLVVKDKRIADIERMKIESRTENKSESIESKEQNRGITKEIKDRNQSSTMDVEYNRRTFNQMQDQLILKDEQIARLQANEKSRDDLLQMTLIDQIYDDKEKVELHSILMNLKKEKVELTDSLAKAQKELDVKASIVLTLESRIETITTKMKDKQYEMDILVKNFGQLGEKNEVIEKRCQCMDNVVNRLAQEILHIREGLVGENCDIEPIAKYVEMLLDIYAAACNGNTATNDMIKELETTRVELLNALNSLFENSRVLHQREEVFDNNSNELSSLREIKKENKSLAEMVVLMTETLHTEREEKENVERNLARETRVMKESMEAMEVKNRCLEKDMMTKISSLEKLNGEVQAKTAEVNNLQNEIARRNNLMAENSSLKTQNARIKKCIDELSNEVQDLNGKLAKITIANEDSSSLKSKLAEAKKSENELVTSYERQISSLTMNKDVTIDTLRKDLAASRSRSAEEVARLTNELSEMRELNSDLERRCNEDSMRVKDQRIHALEHTLCAQEKTVESLRYQLDQVQLSMRDVSEQRRKDLEELQSELMESKSRAMDQDRENTCLKVKLDECKIEYENEIKRLKKDLPISKSMKDLKDTNTMLEVKQRLEQLRVVNIELKEDNIKLSAKLERALIKIRGLEAESEISAEMEKEYGNVRKQLKDLECLLEQSIQHKKQRSRAEESNCKNENVQNRTRKGKGRGKQGGSRTNLLGWGKSKVPPVLVEESD